MKEQLLPTKNPRGYVGMLIGYKDTKATFFFYQDDGKGGTRIITRERDTMEDRYEKLIEPFEFFHNKIFPRRQA